MIDYIIDFIHYIKYSRSGFFKKILITLLFIGAVLISLCGILLAVLLWLILSLLRYLITFVEIYGEYIAAIGFLLFALCITISSGDSFIAHLDAFGSLLLVIFIPLYIELIEELLDYVIGKMMNIKNKNKRYVLLDKVLKM